MMVKKAQLIGILILLVCTTNTFAQVRKSNDSIALLYNEVGSDLPEVRIEMMDSTFITNSDLSTNNHLFFIAFNPTCGHCIREAKLIRDNVALFKDSKVVFVANPNRSSDLASFIKMTEIDQYPNLLLGVDRNGTVKKLAIYGLLPHIIVYDKDHKLVKIFSGDTTIEDLKAYLP